MHKQKSYSEKTEVHFTADKPNTYAIETIHSFPGLGFLVLSDSTQLTLGMNYHNVLLNNFLYYIW